MISSHVCGSRIGPKRNRMDKLRRLKYYLDGEKPITDSIHDVPFYFGIVVVVLLAALLGVVRVIDNILPTPLTVLDEKLYPEKFITERAHKDLRILTNFGPRITGGHENEVVTVDFLLSEINKIIKSADRSQKVETDLQVVSGQYVLKLYFMGIIVSYSDVQNIVVKIHAQKPTNISVLVNAHFDSVPTSPGGSDNGINVAATLELLRKLSKENQRPLHNVILLFNGAEETPLQASHGFIAYHKWAKECKVVVNLDAAGAGGKIMMFQTGPSTPWLNKYYSNVPHPSAQVIAEELFQSNIVPSDTDFRIFRDFGNLVGIDMAFNKDGYRYHTKYDGFDNIPLGSYQHVGDNLLSLVRDISNAPELLASDNPRGDVVYYDFIGLFFLSYSTLVATLVNSFTALLSLALAIFALNRFKLGFNKATFKIVAKSFGSILGGWILAALFVALVSFIFDWIKPMSWYHNTWLVIGLYSVPTIVGLCLPSIFLNHQTLSVNTTCHIQAHVTRVIWTFVLMLGTVLGIRGMYIILVQVLFNCLAFMTISLGLAHTVLVKLWKIVYLVTLIIPTMFFLYLATYCIDFFVPITGRFGANKNADLIIGMFTAGLTLLTVSPFVSLFPLLKKKMYFVSCLGLIFLLFVILAVSPIGFPYDGRYSSPTPQRFWLLHSERVFHDENGTEIQRDAGIFSVNMDRNSPYSVKSYVNKMNDAKHVQDDCKKYLLCGLPLAHAKMTTVIEHSSWIPTESTPELNKRITLEILSKQNITPQSVRYNISVLGTDRINIFLSPKVDVNLTATNLVSNISEVKPLDWNERPLYYITHTCGKALSPLIFTFDVEVPDGWTGPTVDIAVVGLFIHDKYFNKTNEYRSFLSEFPDWADLTAWLGSYKSWTV